MWNGLRGGKGRNTDFAEIPVKPALCYHCISVGEPEMMMKKLILILTTLMVLSPVHAEEEFYTALCIEKGSTGFNWENGKWVQTNFKPEKYLIERVEIVDSNEKSSICLDKYKSTDLSVLGSFKKDKGCYGIRDFGTEIKNHRYRLCPESYRKKGSTWELQWVGCGGWKFLPNGPFHRTEWKGIVLDPKPENDYKPSLAISHGTCSKL